MARSIEQIMEDRQVEYVKWFGAQRADEVLNEAGMIPSEPCEIPHADHENIEWEGDFDMAFADELFLQDMDTAASRSAVFAQLIR